MDSGTAVQAFMQPLFDFIDEATSQGNNVLIHCLAGAHRAGSAGIAYLMHAASLDLDTALLAAKRLRPVVNPIGQLAELLRRYDKTNSSSKNMNMISAH